MSSVVNQEWLNQNALRAYPIKEDCPRMPYDTSGAIISDVVLPNYVLVDFVITMDTGDSPRIYIKQVVHIGNLLTLAFHDASNTLVALLSVDLDLHVKNQGYALAGAGAYDDVRGRVVIGDLTSFKTDLAEGLYNFTIAATELEASTVRPDIRGVRSLQLSNQGNESDYIYGHVKLVAGANAQLTYLPAYNAIQIDALSADGLNEECDCTPLGQDTTVKTINGIAVEDAVIVGDGSCVSVETSGNTITISDTCSKPCCGCPELEFVTDSLKVLDVTVVNLQAFALRLAERIDNFVTNFILTIK